MGVGRGTSIGAHFAPLTDPRADRGQDHLLLDIVTVALCAVICGADGWVAMETFGRAKASWLRTFLALPGGIPSHDTTPTAVGTRRVFARLDPVEFRRCFLGWVRAVVPDTVGQVVALDGKTLRRSHDRSNGKAALHMVSCAGRLLYPSDSLAVQVRDCQDPGADGLNGQHSPNEFAGGGQREIRLADGRVRKGERPRD